MIVLTGYKFRAVRNCRPALIDPSLIVIHWTAGGTLGGAVSWFDDERSKASAHFVIDRDGEVVQCVALELQAWHAGVSEWRGKKYVNNFSVGIELVNWGKVLETPARTVFRSDSGAKVDGSTVVKVGDGWYQAYTGAQFDALKGLVLALRQAMPSLREIVGHSDIAPGRKIDPGPAFPMHGIRAVFEGRQ